MDKGFIWQSKNGTVSTDSDRLAAALAELQRGVVALDGPTTCGKTYVLRRLDAIDGRSVHIRSYREWAEETVLPYLERGEDVTELEAEEGQVFCVEDADYLWGKHTLQLCMAGMLHTLAKKNLVIITGTELDKKTPLLLARLRPLDKYYAKSRCAKE
ncbi:MAG: hypothetical protein IKK83_00195 [Clostridia bacterium]|nr:hypothetical protein [Clostridia bacterium]